MPFFLEYSQPTIVGHISYLGRNKHVTVKKVTLQYNNIVRSVSHLTTKS
jgi:hypothetical protein